jgi:hypothetical protein
MDSYCIWCHWLLSICFGVIEFDSPGLLASSFALTTRAGMSREVLHAVVRSMWLLGIVRLLDLENDLWNRTAQTRQPKSSLNAK